MLDDAVAPKPHFGASASRELHYGAKGNCACK